MRQIPPMKLYVTVRQIPMTSDLFLIWFYRFAKRELPEMKRELSQMYMLHIFNIIYRIWTNKLQQGCDFWNMLWLTSQLKN